MGKTWSSDQRKKFGKDKTKNHRTRASFKKMNPGVRLRTLAVDLSDFQEEKGKGAVPLYVTNVPSSELVADTQIVAMGIGKTEKQLRREEGTDPPANIREMRSDHPSLRGIGWESYTRFSAMNDEALQYHVDFIRRQMQFLTTISRELRRELYVEDAERIQDSKNSYLQKELNSILLYQQRFR